MGMGCPGLGCQGEDPADTGCADTAITVDSQNTPKGKFELRYSKECKTNWMRVGNYAGGAGTGRLMLSVTQPGDSPINFTTSPTPGTHYGDMVVSPGDNCAKGMADWSKEPAVDVSLESSGC